jgi:streptomycin 6-kinase
MVAVSLTPPERLRRTVSAWEGEVGRQWLDRLPELAGHFVERWDLRPERVLEPGGNISMIVLVRRADGTPATLKLGLVTVETEHEPRALRHWDGRGAVRLLEADPPVGVMLLERLQGDVSLRSLPEQKAMLEATAVARRLWVQPAPDHRFTTVAEYVGGLLERLGERAASVDGAGGGPGGVRALADEALRLQAELLAGAHERLVLHGDFHHGNVLGGVRLPWLAIDPKPLGGARAYDLAWLVRDRLATLAASPGPQAAVRRRVKRLAEDLEVDRERLRGWALFRSVEAGLWSLSVGDREDGELLLEFAAWL